MTHCRLPYTVRRQPGEHGQWPAGCLHRSRIARFLCYHVGATAAEHTLAEFFPFLGSHLLPAVAHPASPVSAVAWPAAKSSEQELAQDQNPERLPKGDRV